MEVGRLRKGSSGESVIRGKREKESFVYAGLERQRNRGRKEWDGNRK